MSGVPRPNFLRCPLTNDHRNGHKNRGLGDRNCKQFSHFEVGARSCSSERTLAWRGVPCAGSFEYLSAWE